MIPYNPVMLTQTLHSGLYVTLPFTSRGRSVKRGIVIVHVRMFVCLSVFKTR